MARGRPKGSFTYRSQKTGQPIGVFEWRKERAEIKQQEKDRLRNEHMKNILPTDLESIKRIEHKLKEENTKELINKLHSVLHKIQKAIGERSYNLLNSISNRKEKIEQIFKLSIREYDFIVSKCFLCGFCSFPCDLHHLDGYKENNLKENLIGLCKNCHAGIHYKKEKFLKLLSERLKEHTQTKENATP